MKFIYKNTNNFYKILRMRLFCYRLSAEEKEKSALDIAFSALIFVIEK